MGLTSRYVPKSALATMLLARALAFAGMLLTDVFGRRWRGRLARLARLA
jgi:hypothetical protein